MAALGLGRLISESDLMAISVFFRGNSFVANPWEVSCQRKYFSCCDLDQSGKFSKTLLEILKNLRKISFFQNIFGGDMYLSRVSGHGFKSNTQPLQSETQSKQISFLITDG